jgi:cob(I)alamin adenosyltransferase
MASSKPPSKSSHPLIFIRWVRALQEAADRAWNKCKDDLLGGLYDLVIFDEINYVIDYGYLDLNEVLAALEQKPERVHVVLTGRNAKAELIERADLVTEMKQIKHPYREQGIIAQKGIEF